MNSSFGCTKRKYLKFIGIVISILYTGITQGQLSFENLVKIDKNDGLPNAQINCTHLDQMGFLWLGTKKGLFRYDGRTFINPLMEDINVGKNIKCFIQVDSLHFLVGTDYGIVKLNTLNFDYQFLSLENLSNVNKRYNHVQEIRKSLNNQYWVISTGGICKINSNLTVQKNYAFKEDEIITATNLQPPRICEITENEIWLVAPISSQIDIYNIYSLKDDKLERIKNNPFSDVKRFLSLLNIDRHQCLFLYENEAGKVVSGLLEVKSKKLTYLNTPVVHFQSHQPFFSNINDSLIGVDSKGFSHYLILNKNNRQWYAYKKSLELDYLKSVHVLKDNLIAANNQELFVNSNSSKYIYNLPALNTNDLKSNNRFNYLEHNGYKILSNNNAVTITNLAQKEFTLYLNGKNDIRINQLTGLTKNEVLLSTNKGSLLLNLDNFKIGKLVGVDKPAFFDTLTSKAIKFDNKEVWFGFVKFKGLVKYSIDDKKFTHFPFSEKKQNTFFHEITSIANDDNGNLWLAWIGGGLAKFDTKNAKLTVQTPSNYKDVITSMIKDKHGVIWFGTNGYGLYRFHPDSMIFKRINKTYDPFITSIQCDNNNNIWFTNSSGLIKLNPLNQDLLVLTRKQGLLSGDYERVVYDQNNRHLILSSSMGISIIMDSIVKDIQVANHVYINRIFVNNQRVDETNKILNLKYHENNVIIQFSIPNIKNGNNDKYYSSIDNAKSWQPCFSGEILLTGIKNGTYKVMVKSCNNDNQCYQNEIITIRIATPFWKSLTFFILITLLISLILFLFFKQRIYSLKKINDLKLKIARDLHDSIGANLSSISFLSKAVVNKNISDEKQLSIAQKITYAAMEAGNNIEEIIWNLHPKKKSVFEIINRVISQFEDVLSDKGIQVEVNMDEEMDKYYLSNLSSIHLLMSLKEILNNVTKHSKANRIILNLTIQGALLMIDITDNGIGFDSSEAWGNGLDNIKSRMSEINGKIHIESTINTGTRIMLSLPL